MSERNPASNIACAALGIAIPTLVLAMALMWLDGELLVRNALLESRVHELEAWRDANSVAIDEYTPKSEEAK